MLGGKGGGGNGFRDLDAKHCKIGADHAENVSSLKEILCKIKCATGGSTMIYVEIMFHVYLK